MKCPLLGDISWQLILLFHNYQAYVLFFESALFPLNQNSWRHVVLQNHFLDSMIHKHFSQLLRIGQKIRKTYQIETYVYTDSHCKQCQSLPAHTDTSAHIWVSRYKG